MVAAMNQVTTEYVVVGTNHMVWSSINDAGWSGAACVQWIHTLKGKRVMMTVPENCSEMLLGKVLVAMLDAGVSRIVSSSLE